MVTKLKAFFQGNIFLPLFLIISIFTVGLFHNPAAFTAAAALCIYLAVIVIKNKEIKLNISISSASVFVLVLFYLLSSVWAVDSGVAMFGFYRYLAVALFMIVMMQKNAPSKDVLFSVAAYCGAVMTVVSAVLMQIPSLRAAFSVAERLAGFWQYPNSFALFLLCGVLILITKSKLRIIDFIAIPVLIFGILYSGSRIVFAIMVVSIIAAIIFRRGKKIKLIIGGVFAAVIIAALIYGFVSGNIRVLTRFLTSSLTESSFVGRILYWLDSLPLIASHPFGIGYMGYYYTHTSIQTGVYYLSFIHNDFLQLMIDVGILPAGFFIFALVRSFFKKGTSLRVRLLLFAICAHSFFDFDLQYMVMVMLLALCMDLEEGKQITIKEGLTTVCVAAGALCALLVYFTVGQAAYLLGNAELAYAMNSGDTFAAVQVLARENNNDKVIELADDIIERNEYCSIAYSAKARASFAKGDLLTAMDNKHKVFDLTPFDHDEYTEYCKMLVYSIDRYEQMGDSYSAQVCRGELIETVTTLNSLGDKLSPLGTMIKDQPQTKIVGELAVYIKEYMEND